jgi:soluble NSF attachment protein (SNAP)-like/tetratricopeptide repeat protein
MRDKNWIIGEFVETVQLQVVCQTLLNKVTGAANEITMEHLEQFGNIDMALQVFYEESVNEAVKATREKGITEGAVRQWFEKKLITPAETRGLVYRGKTHTDGLLNDAVNVLDRTHLIREERRGGGRWYELSHDRFIYPIKDSNKKWLLQYSSAATTREWLEKKAARWMETGNDADLLDQSELPEAERWLLSPESTELGYDAAVVNLVQASRTYLRNCEIQRRMEFETAKREAMSARTFRRLTYALAVISFVAIIASVAAFIYAGRAKAEKAKGEALQKEGARLTEEARVARAEAKTAQDRADLGNAEALIAQEHANKAAQSAQRLQIQANQAQASARTALNHARNEQQKAKEAWQTDALYREAVALSLTNEGKQEAITKFQQAVGAYQKVKDREAESGTNITIGDLYEDLSESERAEEFFNNAIEVYRRPPMDPVNQARVLNNIALVYGNSRRADIKKSKEKLNRALTIYRRQKEPLGEAATLVNLLRLNVRSSEANPEITEQYWSRAIELFTLITDERPDPKATLTPKAGRTAKAKGPQETVKSPPQPETDVASVRNTAKRNFGAFLTYTGDYAQQIFAQHIDNKGVTNQYIAESVRPLYYKAAAQYFHDINDNKGMALAYSRLAALDAQLFRQTDDEKKRARFKDDLEANYKLVIDLLNDPASRAGAYTNLGNFFQASLEEKDAAKAALFETKAAEAFETAVQIYQKADDRPGQISAFNRIADFYGSQAIHKDTAKAVEKYSKALNLYRELKNVTGQADTYIRIGRLYKKEQRLTEADEAFNKALDLYEDNNPQLAPNTQEEIGDIQSLADRREEIGDIYYESNDTGSLMKALTHYTEAAKIYRATNIRSSLGDMYDSMSRTYGKLADRVPEKAQEFYAKQVEDLTLKANLYEKAEQYFMQLDRARTLVKIAALNRDKLHDPIKACDKLKEARKVYENINLHYLAVDVEDDMRSLGPACLEPGPPLRPLER